MAQTARSGVLLALAFLAAAGCVALMFVTALGPLTQHMGAHLLLMNLIAPAAAMAGTRTFDVGSTLRSTLFAASAVQILALWAAHAPSAVELAARLPAVHVAVQAVLFAAAVWFWLAVFAQTGPARWRALFALLITGKLFCLLAALLVFAPRYLYPAAALLHSGHGSLSADPLADQQLAGLLMLIVCPLTYVVAGVVIAARWLREIAQGGASADLPQPAASISDR
jgi:putative membrane protein